MTDTNYPPVRKPEQFMIKALIIFLGMCLLAGLGLALSPAFSVLSPVTLVGIFGAGMLVIIVWANYMVSKVNHPY